MKLWFKSLIFVFGIVPLLVVMVVGFVAALVGGLFEGVHQVCLQTIQAYIRRAEKALKQFEAAEVSGIYGAEEPLYEHEGEK